MKYEFQDHPQIVKYRIRIACTFSSYGTRRQRELSPTELVSKTMRLEKIVAALFYMTKLYKAII